MSPPPPTQPSTPRPAVTQPRELITLAIPAFATLIAEPLYVLADSAVVGRLGLTPLAGLGLASALIVGLHSLFIFLAYGTTAAVSRAFGAGNEREATAAGVQGMWLGAILGLALALGAYLAAAPVIGALTESDDVAKAATIYLQIAALGSPGQLLTMAGTGFLRGGKDTARPLAIVVSAVVANLLIELVLIEGFGFGIGASALATAIAQSAAGLAFAAIVAGRAKAFAVPLGPDIAAIRSMSGTNRDLFIRTAGLRGATIVGTFVASRMSTSALAAYETAFAFWIILANALDALAIAAQSAVGFELGAKRGDQARQLGSTAISWTFALSLGLAAVLAPLAPRIPALFTDHPPTQELMMSSLYWVAALLPLGGLAWALDGVLMGAQDTRFLARSMAVAAVVYCAIAAVIALGDLGLWSLWAALGVLSASRAVALGKRFLSLDWGALADQPTSSKSPNEALTGA